MKYRMIASIFALFVLVGCKAGGMADAVDRWHAGKGGTTPDPFAWMGWIGLACLMGAALYFMNLKIIQGAAALATGIAFIWLGSFLKACGTIILWGGVAAAAYFIGTNWGMVREQIRAWLASRKLALEGKIAEATALKRQAFPIVDWSMKRASKRRKKALKNSGSIKPTLEDKA